LFFRVSGGGGEIRQQLIFCFGSGEGTKKPKVFHPLSIKTKKKKKKGVGDFGPWKAGGGFFTFFK